ncbi:MAG: hypothetical protein ACMUIU_13120 [bacterium]
MEKAESLNYLIFKELEIRQKRGKMITLRIEDRKQIEDIILETLKLDNRIIIVQVCQEN